MERDQLYSFMGRTGMTLEEILRNLEGRGLDGLPSLTSRGSGPPSRRNATSYEDRPFRKRISPSKRAKDALVKYPSSDSDRSPPYDRTPRDTELSPPHNDLRIRGGDSRRHETETGFLDDQMPGPSGSNLRGHSVVGLQKRSLGSSKSLYRKPYEHEAGRRYLDVNRRPSEEEPSSHNAAIEESGMLAKMKMMEPPSMMRRRRRARKYLGRDDEQCRIDGVDSDSGISDGIASKPQGNFEDDNGYGEVNAIHRRRGHETALVRRHLPRTRHRDFGKSLIDDPSCTGGDLQSERIRSWDALNKRRRSAEERFLTDGQSGDPQDLLSKIMDEVSAEKEHQKAEAVQKESPKKSGTSVNLLNTKLTPDDSSLPVYFCHYCSTETYNMEGHEVHMQTSDHIRKTVTRKIKLMDELRSIYEQAELELQEKNLKSGEIECCDECLLPFAKNDAYHKHTLHLHKAAVPLMQTKCEICDMTLPNRWLYESHLVSLQHVKNDICSRIAKGIDPEENLLLPGEHHRKVGVGSQFVQDIKVQRCKACDEMFSIDSSSSIHCMSSQHFENVEILVLQRQDDESNEPITNR